MSHQVIRSSDGKPRVLLQGEPPYCHAFEAAPSALPQQARTGRWLVLLFAAWSLPDVRSVGIALEAVKRFGGAVQLGLQPYDDSGPEIEAGSPVWLFFDQGDPAFERRGLITVDALVTAIEAAFPAIVSRGP